MIDCEIIDCRVDEIRKQYELLRGKKLFFIKDIVMNVNNGLHIHTKFTGFDRKIYIPNRVFDNSLGIEYRHTKFIFNQSPIEYSNLLFPYAMLIFDHINESAKYKLKYNLIEIELDDLIKFYISADMPEFIPTLIAKMTNRYV